MTPPSSRMRFDDRVRAKDRLYAERFHTGDRKVLAWGFGVAVVLHLGLLLIPVPRTRATSVTPPEDGAVLLVRKYVPPPPRIARAPIVAPRPTRRLPIPDPTPDEPEPIHEPEMEEIEPQGQPPDVEFIVGEPEPPPSKGPLFPGVAGVTSPTRIAASYVQPVYPENARRAKIGAKVFLQVIVERDGSVGEVSVLRCNRPDLGFEDAAVAAVRQWRYEPATQNGNPVVAVITVIVEFAQR